nr:lipid phosphate phosphohydrolase 3 [Hymenolepis microstoma]
MPDISLGSALQAFIQVCGITAAFYVGLTRITDNKHHPHDVLVGFIIGAAVAIFTVRYATDVAEFNEIEEDGVDRSLNSWTDSKEESVHLKEKILSNTPSYGGA